MSSTATQAVPAIPYESVGEVLENTRQMLADASPDKEAIKANFQGVAESIRLQVVQEHGMPGADHDRLASVARRVDNTGSLVTQLTATASGLTGRLGEFLDQHQELESYRAKRSVPCA